MFALNAMGRMFYGITLIAGAIGGIIAFLAVPIALVLTARTGGSALLGGAEGGRFFVAAHGETHGVGAGMFYAMYTVELIAVASVLPFMIACVMLLLTSIVKRGNI